MIISDPDVMMGKPVVAGTRITVEMILEKMAARHTHQQILAAHPRLKEENILEAIEYAANVLRSEAVFPLVKKSA